MEDAMKDQDERLYELMTDMGDTRVRERFIQLRDRGMVSETGPGARLLAQSAGQVLDAIKVYIEKNADTKSIRNKRIVAMLRQVGVEKAVALSVRTILNRVAAFDGSLEATTVHALRSRLSLDLKREADFAHLEKANPIMFRYLSHRLPDASARETDDMRRRLSEGLAERDCGWDRQDCAMISAIMLEYIRRYAGLVDIKQVVKEANLMHRRKIFNIMVLRPEVLEWLSEGVNFMMANSPTNLPITTRPLDWSPTQVGGYPGRDSGHIDMMTTKRHTQYKTFLESDCPLVYQGLNTLQSTPWRINAETFEIFRIAVRNSWTGIGLSPIPPEVPLKPAHEFKKGDPAWMAWGKKNAAYKIEERAYVADHLSATRALTIGQIYEEFDRFYYPHQIDYRTRCYPIGTPLGYQGPDWQRGLLEFADGKPIGTPAAYRWFLIHGANCYGEDKCEMVERVRWVAQNSEHIIRSAEDPVDYRWWTEADKPFQFLAWCFEYRNSSMLDDPLDYVSHIPVCMDGSNNGLQIYSLLMRDPVGCEATNCRSEQEPEDAYQRVANILTERLKDLQTTAESEKHRRWAKRVLDFLKSRGLAVFPRQAVKRPVMTQPYGATKYTCQRYIIEWYHEYVRGKSLVGADAPFPERDVYNIFHWIGSLVWDIIGEVVVKAREAMLWLQEVSDILSEHDVQFRWVTPLGVQCEQRYIKGTIKTIHLRGDKRVAVRVWEDNDEILSTKARNGICPNLIHSFDASAMFLTVCRASEQGVTHFQMIHDSFGCHAADAPTLAQVLREAYVEILQGDPLRDLRDSLQSALPSGVVLPDPPEQGDYDIEELLTATYFFA